MCNNQTKYQLEIMATFFEQNSRVELSYDPKTHGVIMKIGGSDVFLGLGGGNAATEIKQYLSKQK